MKGIGSNVSYFIFASECAYPLMKMTAGLKGGVGRIIEYQACYKERVKYSVFVALAH